MKLFYVPNTRASRVRFMLEEVGAPYELVRMQASDTKTPEYLKVHPLGNVPAFQDDDGTVVIESAAIIMHLADKFPEKRLAPPPGSKERAAYYQWIIFAMTTFEPQVSTVAQHTSYLPEAQRVPAIAESARARFKDVAKVVDAALAGREFIVGDRFSAADVVLAGVCGYARIVGLVDAAAFPNISAYVGRIYGRETAKKARAD